MANKQGAVSRFLFDVADGVGNAIADIRHRWEESWFGREVTPEHADMASQSGWTNPGAEEKAVAWDALCDRLAKEQGQRSSREHDREPDLDR